MTYFDDPRLWGHAPEDYQVQVLRDLQNLIPKDVSSILDAGCGDGFIANALTERYQVVGLDASESALQHVRCPHQVGTITRLPFADDSFDLAMANDVLEHLDEATVAIARAELLRVARRYLIITVPFMENLQDGLTRCTQCDCEYHVNGHQRAYDMSRILELFPNWRPAAVILTGAEWERDFDWLTSYQRNRGCYVSAPASVCPNCGGRFGVPALREKADPYLVGLRACQANAIAHCPEMFDRLRLRTEAMCLYAKEPAPPIQLRGRVVPIGQAKETTTSLPLGEIDFGQPEVHQRADLPHLGRLPYFSCSGQLAPRAAGLEFAPTENSSTWELKLGFFAATPAHAQLTFKGVAAAPRRLSLARYSDDAGYVRCEPIDLPAGPFESLIPLPDLEISQFGYLFRVGCTDSVVLTSVSLNALPSRPYLDGSGDYLQRRLGTTELYLSLALYGRRVPYPAWFEQVEFLRADAAKRQEAVPAWVSSGMQRNVELASLRAHTAELQESWRQCTSDLPQQNAQLAKLIMKQSQIVGESIQVLAQELNGHLAQVSNRLGNLERQVSNRLGNLERQVRASLLERFLRFGWRCFRERRIQHAVLRRLHLARSLPRRLRAWWQRRHDLQTWTLPRAAPRSVTMLVPDTRIDRRVLLQARSLVHAGWTVTVIAGPAPKDHLGVDEQAFPEVRIVRVRTDETPDTAVLGKRWEQEKRWHEFYWLHGQFLLEALRNPGQIVVGHDLPVLPAAVHAGQLLGAIVVYDAHELYPEQAGFNAELKEKFAMAEQELITHPELVITVNHSIAAELAERYGIDKPAVVLNTPSAPAVGGGSQRLRARLPLAPGTRILLYQGGLCAHRNLENLVTAMASVQRDDVALVLLGPDGGLRPTLERLARQAGLRQRVFFLDSVPIDQLLGYTADADAGIVPYPDHDLNSYYCTPNKLFEFMVAGLPILANDLPELRQFVEGQGIGQNFAMPDAHRIAAAIDAFFAADLQAYRERCRIVGQDYVWEKHEAAFVKLYEDLVAAHGQRSRRSVKRLPVPGLLDEVA